MININIFLLQNIKIIYIIFQKNLHFYIKFPQFFHLELYCLLIFLQFLY